MSGWRDLGDDELAAHLQQRGLDAATVAELVRGREDDRAAAVIAEVLDA